MVRIVLTLGIFCSFAASAGAGPEPLAAYGGTGDWPVFQSGEVIFDNIEPNGGLGGLSPASQLDTTYAGVGFDSGAADDFVLPDTPEGKWLLTELHWSGSYFSGAQVGNVNGFNIIIWPDAGGEPAGGGPGDAPDYSQALYIQKIDDNANETRTDFGPETADYWAEIDPKHLLPGVTYWLEIQAQMNFAFDGKWGWQGTVESTGNTYRQGFPLLGINFWDNVGLNDTAFSMVGKSVPEPTSLLLLGGGAVALLRRRRRM